MVGLLIYPLAGVVLRSLDPTGALSYSSPNWSGTNYKAVWSDPASRIILRNTVVLAAIAAALAVAVAYPIAAFLSRLSARWARILLLLALIPFWTSIVVRMYALQLILEKFGLLFTQTASMAGMVAYLLPYLVLIFYGGMVGINDDLIRAARSLGARPWRAFWHVFAPLTKPVVLAGTLLVFVIGLGFFITPALLGPPSGITVSMFIQQQVNIAQWGIASAMGTGLLVVALVIYFFFDRIFNIENLAGSGAQVRARASGSGSLEGWGRWALALWSALVFAFLLLPLGYVILVSFSNQSYLSFPPQGLSLRWYRALFDDPTWRDSAWLSLRIAAVTTVLATAIGLLAALALTRGKVPARRFFRALFLLPLIVPVILIGAAIFDLESRLHLSGTLFGYALGHTLLALPFTVLICSAALQQLGSSLEEAARSLGASRLRAFVAVTLPLILPSVGAAAVFSFITSWDEPVISLFLRGITPTLPVHIFDFVRQTLDPTVAALATTILAVVLLAALAAFGSARAIRIVRERWRRRHQLLEAAG